MMEDIEKTEVALQYDGPRFQMPLTLETTQAILDHFKKRKVRFVYLNLIFLVDLMILSNILIFLIDNFNNLLSIWPILFLFLV